MRINGFNPAFTSLAESTAHAAAPAGHPGNVAERQGIIVIGGSQAHERAATVGAKNQGPLLQGIIIVGGSFALPLIPKGR